jgi:ribonuclease HI
MITGLTPIDIRRRENAQLYQITKGNKPEEDQFDHDTRTKHWLHPAISFTILEDGRDDDSSINIFSDGSKNGKGAGAGVAIFINGKHTTSIQYRLNKRCTNNQSEQVAILKYLEYMRNINTAVKKLTIYTDSQKTLDSINKFRIHISLIDNIRLQTWQLKKGLMERQVLLGQGTRWHTGERPRRQASKGGSYERRHRNQL